MTLTIGKLCAALCRRKSLSKASGEDPVSAPEGTTRLGRVLNFADLTALGVGSTLGVGVYVLAGHVARDVAGPSVVISFAIAAIGSFLAGLCYAEFGGREPRAGSAYTYSYICSGELVAFIIGWNLILEYVIGSASVARGVSVYLDSILDGVIGKAFASFAPLSLSFLAGHVDFLAFILAVLFAVALALGVKKSTMVNNLFSLLNLVVVVFVIIAGSIKIDIKNWKIKPETLPAVVQATQNIGSGGFFPFGVMGTIKGAATCFYGYIGFDCISASGEEVQEPRKTIPRAIIATLVIVFISYFGVSAVITLMLPYYDQNRDAPLPYAFAAVGWNFAKWIVAIGGLFGLITSLFGCMFPLPRILYAMASDGLIFRFMGRVSDTYNTPVSGTILAGLLTGLMAALFDLNQLVNMMSIGTLTAYTMVAACVLLLRYDASDSDNYTTTPPQERSALVSKNKIVKHNLRNVLSQVINREGSTTPTSLSQYVFHWLICIYGILCLALGLSLVYGEKALSKLEPWIIVLCTFLSLLLVLNVYAMARQPSSGKPDTFSVPLVPYVPAISIFVNILLILMLDPATWIRFGIWMTIGFLVFVLTRHCVRKNDDTTWRSVTPRSKIPIRNNPIPSVELPHNINYAYENCVEIETMEEVKQSPISMHESLVVLPDLVMPTKALATTLTNNSCDKEEKYSPNLQQNVDSLNEKHEPKNERSDQVFEPSETVMAYFDDILQNEDTESSTFKSSPELRKSSSKSNNSSIKSIRSSISSTESCLLRDGALKEFSDTCESKNEIDIKNDEFKDNDDKAHCNDNIQIVNPAGLVNSQNDGCYKPETDKTNTGSSSVKLRDKNSDSASIRSSLFAQKLEKILGDGIGSLSIEGIPPIQSVPIEQNSQLSKIAQDSNVATDLSTSTKTPFNIPSPPKMPTPEILRKINSTPANLNKLRISVIPLFEELENRKSNLRHRPENVLHKNINETQLLNNQETSELQGKRQPETNAIANKNYALVTVTPYSSPEILNDSMPPNLLEEKSDKLENNINDGANVMSRAELRDKLNSILAFRLSQVEPKQSEQISILPEHNNEEHDA